MFRNILRVLAVLFLIGWHQLGMGAGVAVCFFSCLGLGLTFIVRKRTFA